MRIFRTRKESAIQQYNMTIFDQLQIFAHFYSFLAGFWPILTQKFNSGIFHGNFQNQERKCDPTVYNMTIFDQLQILRMWGSGVPTRVPSRGPEKWVPQDKFLGSFWKLVPNNPMNQKCTRNKVYKDLQVKCTNPPDYEVSQNFGIFQRGLWHLYLDNRAI